MQNSEHKIDKVFKRKLGQFEVDPPHVVWDRIEESLGYRKRKKRMLLIWTLSGAASVVLAFLTGWFIASHSIKQIEVYTERIEAPIVTKPHAIISEPEKKVLQVHLYKPQFVKATLTEANYDQKKATNNEEESQDFLLHLLAPIKPAALFYHQPNFLLAGLTSNKLSQSDQAIIAANLLAMNKNDQEKKTNGRWSVGMQVSPVSSFDELQLVSSSNDFMAADFVSADNTAAYNTVSSNVSANYETTLSGGVKVMYEAGKKISFITGLGYNEVAQFAGNVTLSYAGQNWLLDGANLTGEEYAANNSSNISTNNVILNTNVGVANVNLPAGVALASVKNYSIALESNQNYKFEQSMGYVEVPLLMRYQLVDKKIDLHVLGGINTNILIRNNVSLANQNHQLASSSTQGLRPVVLSTSVGMGIAYNLTKRFCLNLEPTYKINLSSLNKNASYSAQPHSFGIFSGINYSF